MTSEDFYKGKTISINHIDDWRFIVQFVNDEEGITVSYQDQQDEKIQPNIERMCLKTARMLADALLEMADEFDPKEAQEHVRSTADFQMGFQAGVAYTEHGDDAYEAAARAAKELTK